MTKYKSIDTWANAMRKDKKKDLWADYFMIGGHLYTIEEYDESGKYMRYTSATAWEHLTIETSNRYSKTWLTDMEVSTYSIDDTGLRFAIDYYLSEDMTKKQIRAIAENLYKQGDNKNLLYLLDYLTIE